MKVKTTTIVYLEVHPEEFDITFSWDRKRGVENDHWFTPSGKCKMWIGGLHTQLIGKVKPKVYKELVRQLKANKTELFTWGTTFYCVSGEDSITEIRNMETILLQARAEWEERKYVEEWVEDQRELTEQIRVKI